MVLFPRSSNPIRALFWERRVLNAVLFCDEQKGFPKDMLWFGPQLTFHLFVFLPSTSYYNWCRQLEQGIPNFLNTYKVLCGSKHFFSGYHKRPVSPHARVFINRQPIFNQHNVTIFALVVFLYCSAFDKLNIIIKESIEESSMHN